MNIVHRVIQNVHTTLHNDDLFSLYYRNALSRIL